MATETNRIYVDTNILAYMANTKAPEHKLALEIFSFFGEKPHAVFFVKETLIKSAWDESPSRTMILDGFDFLYIS